METDINYCYVQQHEHQVYQQPHPALLNAASYYGGGIGGTGSRVELPGLTPQYSARDDGTATTQCVWNSPIHPFHENVNWASYGLANPEAKCPPMSAHAFAIARRNERERNRVRHINSTFEKLRRHLPSTGRRRKLSKVDTLRTAIRYIEHLSTILDETGDSKENGEVFSSNQRNASVKRKKHNKGSSNHNDTKDGVSYQSHLHHHHNNNNNVYKLTQVKNQDSVIPISNNVECVGYIKSENSEGSFKNNISNATHCLNVVGDYDVTSAAKLSNHIEMTTMGPNKPIKDCDAMVTIGSNYSANPEISDYYENGCDLVDVGEDEYNHNYDFISEDTSCSSTISKFSEDSFV